MTENDLNGHKVFLVANSLDTVAEVRLNGHLAAISLNMFRRLRVEITTYLRVGDNQLEIRFLSPVGYGHFLSDTYGVS